MLAVDDGDSEAVAVAEVGAVAVGTADDETTDGVSVGRGDGDAQPDTANAKHIIVTPNIMRSWFTTITLLLIKRTNTTCLATLPKI